MKVKIGETTYTKIKSLSFAPETNIASSQIPINEFVVDIMSTDAISVGIDAFLYDDMDKLWAKYWITSAEQINESTVRVTAESKLTLLDRKTEAAVMYNGAPLSDVLASVFSSLSTDEWSLDSSFDSATVTGFFPEQTQRTRLQWICFTIGAFVKSYFSEKIEIVPTDTTETLIPINRIYWKPSVEYSDYVTAIKVTAYSYAQGTPATTDKWVSDGTNTYIQIEQTFTITNTDAPSTAPENVLEISGITIINTDNVDEILTQLAYIYFKRISAEMEVINNAEYQAGEMILAYINEETMISAYIEKCTFTFGLQAKSKLELTPVMSVLTSDRLTILYVWEGFQLDRKVYHFPANYPYSVKNPYIDTFLVGHHYVFRPQKENAEGTVLEGGTTDTEYYDRALDLFETVLDVQSVDELTEEEKTSSDTTIKIVQIA